MIEVRKQIKAKKPNFIRQDAHKKDKLKAKWRKPKGLQSKMRLHKKGYSRSPSQGWRSPKTVRGLDASGLEVVHVARLQDLQNVTKDQGIIIQSTVGAKNKIALLKAAQEKNIRVLNLKPEEYIKLHEEKYKERQEKSKTKKKAKVVKAKEKKTVKKKDLDEELTEEERKMQEKKERDHELIHSE